MKSLSEMKKDALEISPQFLNTDLTRNIEYYHSNYSDYFGNKFNKLPISEVLSKLNAKLFDCANLTMKGVTKVLK